MAKTNPPLIQCSGLGKSYEAIEAVSEVGFELEESESASILGPSGCGKSTLLRLIAGLEVPDRGSVSLFGREISTPQRMLPPEKRRFGMVFQDYRLIPDRTVFENIALPLQIEGVSKKNIKDKVREIMEKVGLDHRMNNYPYQLSGGEKQRVSIARALVKKPLVILADEPTGNLDPNVSDEILDLLEIATDSGAAVLMSTHNFPLVQPRKKRFIELNEGRLVTQ